MPVAMPDADDLDRRVVVLPEDIVALRGSDPAAAARWRLDVREALQSAFSDGYRIVSVTTDDAYLLERI